MNAPRAFRSFALLTLAAGVVASCRGISDPCANDSECRPGLICESGECITPGATGGGGGTTGGGTTGGGTTGGGTTGGGTTGGGTTGGGTTGGGTTGGGTTGGGTTGGGTTGGGTTGGGTGGGTTGGGTAGGGTGGGSTAGGAGGGGTPFGGGTGGATGGGTGGGGGASTGGGGGTGGGGTFTGGGSGTGGGPPPDAGGINPPPVVILPDVRSFNLLVDAIDAGLPDMIIPVVAGAFYVKIPRHHFDDPSLLGGSETASETLLVGVHDTQSGSISGFGLSATGWFTAGPAASNQVFSANVNVPLDMGGTLPDAGAPLRLLATNNAGSVAHRFDLKVVLNDGSNSGACSMSMMAPCAKEAGVIYHFIPSDKNDGLRDLFLTIDIGNPQLWPPFTWDPAVQYTVKVRPAATFINLYFDPVGTPTSVSLAYSSAGGLLGANPLFMSGGQVPIDPVTDTDISLTPLTNGVSRTYVIHVTH
ncbi:MAG: dickkopf-related protein [Myxococcaceae bacterium]